MGTKNNPDSFVSSVISSNTNTFSTSGYQYANTGNSQHHITNAGRTTNPSKSAAYIGKHRLPMQLSRPPATGSIGVSVITPAVGVQSSQKEVHYNKLQQQHNPSQQQHLQHMQKVQSVRNSGDGHSRSHMFSNSPKMASQHSTGVTITPISNAYLPGKSKMVTSTPTASAVHAHTQHLPKYLSSSRFLVNTDKGDVFMNDDGMLGEIPDKRAQYSNRLPPDYQYVLQDHSYSQLPESPPPPPVPPSPIQQRTTFNGLSRISTPVGPTKVTLNNNRIVNVSGGVGYSSLTNNVSGGRLNNQASLPLSNNSMNSYSSVTAIVNSVASNVHSNSSTSVIAVNPKRNLQSHGGLSSAFTNIPRGLLKTGIISDKPEESDLSEDDRIPDPHGEETETAPEAEGEEESVTRCICDFQHDDGYMISCDKCLAWQHVDCMGIDWHQIPDEYQCEKCQPRYVDKRRAIEIQKKKIAEKLCVGVNDDSDSSDTPVLTTRNNKPQTKRKYKGKRTTGAKRKNVKESKEPKPKKNLGSVKKRQLNDSMFGVSPPQSPSLSSGPNMTAEKKKQLLLERKQMLLEKKQITKKRSMRKQAQNTKRNIDKSKVDDDYDHRNTSVNSDKVEGGDHSIQQVREWVDRYEEAVTNHYSQELRARLNASQVNGVNSDLKFSASLRSVEKCKTSLLSTGGKIVLATCSLSPNQPIIELRGKYMYTGAESFKQSKISPFTPYVFYYKLPLPKQELEICVDCRSYGNFARFVRRSCKPNAELRHCIRKTSLHLYIIATQPLKKNSEILIGHYGPETAGSCVCGSVENCTAAKTPYPVISSARLNEKLKESQVVRSSSPMSSETNAKNKKTPVNTDKGKKKVKEEKKKLTKEKRRGRRRSPSMGSDSDQESSSRDQSPSAPAKLTVSLWGKPAVMLSSNLDATNRTSSDNESQPEDTTLERPTTPVVSRPASPVESKTRSPAVSAASSPSPVTTSPTTESAAAITTAATSPVTSTTAATTTNCTESAAATDTAGNSTPKQNTRSTRQSEYARKEKQQLDMPLFFQTPNNHKMTREEKKIQAIMKAFEAMEKSEARKQESQKHRRESTSESETPGKKSTPCRKNLKSRKSIDESKDRDEKPRKSDENDTIRKDSQNEDDDDDAEGAKENSADKGNVTVKVEPKSDSRKTDVVENGELVKVESRDDEDDDDEESDNTDKESTPKDDPSKRSHCPTTPTKVNNKLESDEKDESEEESNDESGDPSIKPKKNEKLKSRTPCRTSRTSRPTPKARATPKSKVIRGKKRKSESDADGSVEAEINDISERTRSAVQRQKKAACGPCGKDDKCASDRKNAAAYSPAKVRKVDDPVVSPYSTPPKSRERLDSSSSSGGTPPTPVSDTCLLVASAIGHLTDFKFPNTKKELINAWFKEERKPDEENAGKLPNQEGNNEYAKKRWLRQAISEEGDSSIPRPEESVSPNGDYGGPLKKRRFARESMSEQTCSSPVASSFANANQMSFDDEDDVSSPDAFLFRASEGDSAVACHPTPLQNVAAKSEESDLVFKPSSSETTAEKVNALGPLVDEDIAKVASESVADTIASILAPVNAQISSPPRPPSVPPPRTPSPPPAEPEKPVQERRSPPISRKKLSLTEYQQRKSGVPLAVNPPEPPGDVAQEVPALAAAPPPTIDPADTVGRSSSRSSITSSSCSEEEDNSHVASAQVIARSLMIESRHLSYGPQASALFNSIRSGTGSQLFNSKTSTPPGPPLPRENLADRLKREFDVHVQEDENEKNKIMPPPLSPIRIPVQVTSQMPSQMPPQMVSDLTLSQKDLHLRLKKAQPPPPPPPLPCIPPPLLPPLPEPPQLFAPNYFPYPVRAPFFAAPPPPPPPGPPPPVPPPTLLAGPPPPPPPPK